MHLDLPALLSAMFTSIKYLILSEHRRLNHMGGWKVIYTNNQEMFIIGLTIPLRTVKM